MAQDKKSNVEIEKQGITIPAGTEQETGLTRGETEKVNGPVKMDQPLKKAIRNKKKR